MRGINNLDQDKKQSYYEQLRMAQELKKKTQLKNDSDTEDSEDEDEEGDSYEKSHKKIMDILDGKKDPEDMPKFGVMRLPFMQRALERQKEKTKTEAMKILDDMRSSIFMLFKFNYMF